MIGPHKVIAMAQRQTPYGLIAQGSIPMAAPTTLNGAEHSAIYGLERHLPGITRPKLQAVILQEIEQHFGVRLIATPLTPIESRTATRLARMQYQPIPTTTQAGGAPCRKGTGQP